MNEVQGMRNYLGIFEGMQVMLLRNMWQQAGLVNGAMGTVRAVVWGEDEDVPHPEFVVVEFDDYRGPAFKHWPTDGRWAKDVDRSKWIPIPATPVCTACDNIREKS